MPRALSAVPRHLSGCLHSLPPPGAPSQGPSPSQPIFWSRRSSPASSGRKSSMMSRSRPALGSMRFMLLGRRQRVCSPSAFFARPSRSSARPRRHQRARPSSPESSGRVCTAPCWRRRIALSSLRVSSRSPRPSFRPLLAKERTTGVERASGRPGPVWRLWPQSRRHPSW